MKTLIFGLLLIVASTGLNKCEKGEEDADFKVSLNETFELAINKAVKIEGEDLGFTFSKNEESRCPSGVSCIVAGEAIVTLDIMTKSGVESVQFTAKGLCYEDDGSCGERKEVMGYTFQLINVYPYPKSGGEGPLRVKMEIGK